MIDILKNKEQIEAELGFKFEVTGYKNVDGKLVLTLQKDNKEMQNQADLEKEIGFDILGTDYVFSKGFVEIKLDGSSDYQKASVKRPLLLVSRSQAMKLVGIDNPRIRDYELEMELHEKFDMAYFINEICPINGFSICPKEFWN